MEFLLKIKKNVLWAWDYLESKRKHIPVEDLKRINNRSVQLFLKLLNDSLHIMVAPRSHWGEVFAGGKGAARELKLAVLFGIAVVAVGTFIGHLIFNSLYGFFLMPAMRAAIGSTLILLLHLFVFLIVSHQVGHWILKQTVAIESLRRLVFFSILPTLLVAIIVAFFPFLEPLNVLGLYSFYLLYTGLQSLYKLPEERKLQLEIVAMAAFVIASLVIHLIVYKFMALIFN